MLRGAVVEGVSGILDRPIVVVVVVWQVRGEWLVMVRMMMMIMKSLGNTEARLCCAVLCFGVFQFRAFFG